MSGEAVRSTPTVGQYCRSMFNHDSTMGSPPYPARRYALYSCPMLNCQSGRCVLLLVGRYPLWLLYNICLSPNCPPPRVRLRAVARLHTYDTRLLALSAGRRMSRFPPVSVPVRVRFHTAHCAQGCSLRVYRGARRFPPASAPARVRFPPSRQQTSCSLSRR